MSCGFSAQELCTVLRENAHSKMKEAMTCLISLIREQLKPGARPARTVPLGSFVDESAAQELAHDFWLMLQDNPKVLDVAAVQGYGAIRRQIARFLRECPSLSLESAEVRLRQHFETKLRGVLRAGEFIELRRGVWGLDSVNPTVVDSTALRLLKGRIFDIDAVWTPQREGQDPPIARPADIARFALAAMKAAEGFIRFYDLSQLAWDALRPHFAAAVPHTIDTPVESDAETRIGPQDYLLVKAVTELANSLDPQTLEAARLHYGEIQLSYRTIADRLLTSKSTVDRKLDDFRSALHALAVRHQLDATDIPIFAATLRDILSS